MSAKHPPNSFLRLEGGSWGCLVSARVAIGSEVELIRRDGECVQAIVTEELPPRLGCFCYRLARSDVAPLYRMLRASADRNARLEQRIDVLLDLLWGAS